MNTHVIDPHEALCLVLEYTVANGMAELIVLSTLEQRLHMMADITVVSAIDIAPLQLSNVGLPNFVLSKIRDVVRYDFDLKRVNII